MNGLKSNLEEKFQVAKARVEKTKADFERAEELIGEQIIGQKENGPVHEILLTDLR